MKEVDRGKLPTGSMGRDALEEVLAIRPLGQAESRGALTSFGSCAPRPGSCVTGELPGISGREETGLSAPLTQGSETQRKIVDTAGAEGGACWRRGIGSCTC